MSAAAAASLQAPSSSVVREVGKLEAVARMTMSGSSVGVAGGAKTGSPSTAPALSSHPQQTTRAPTNTGGGGTHHSAFNGAALSQLPPTNGTNPLQCLQQMTVIGPDVKPDMSGSQKLCSTTNSNYPLGFTEQWAAFTQQLGGSNSGYFNNAFNVPTSTMFNYPVLTAGGPPPFIDPTTGRISGAWADLDPAKKGKGRQTYNRSQTHTLENTFMQNRYVTRKQRAELERQTLLTDRQIKIWFQNRRMKAKKDTHRQADEQVQQQPNNGSSQQALIAHPPTPTSGGQLNTPKTADVRVNSTRNDGANLRHGNLTPPLSRGMDHASFGGYNCHFPTSAYPHFSAFPGQFATAEMDGRSQKGVSFPASASSMSTSNGQMWGQGCFDAWQMMNTMDTTALSMLQQQSLAALSTTPIGCYNGGGGGGPFQPNPPQECAPSGASNPAGYHQYTANENR